MAYNLCEVYLQKFQAGFLILMEIVLRWKYQSRPILPLDNLNLFFHESDFFHESEVFLLHTRRYTHTHALYCIIAHKETEGE